MILEQLGMLNGKRFYDWSQLEMVRIYKGKLKTGENIIFYPCEHDVWISQGDGYSVKSREKKYEIVDVFTRKRFFLHDFIEVEPTDLKKP